MALNPKEPQWFAPDVAAAREYHADRLARYPNGASVQMPPIGTGQGATPWPTVRDLILEELVERDVAVTVYVLEGEPMPEETPDNGQLTLA